jgi:hypothetical protein
MPPIWKNGILGIKAKTNYLNGQKILYTHHSITPLFHYSLRGVGPTLRPVGPTGWKRSRRPIGAKPLLIKLKQLSGNVEINGLVLVLSIAF